MHIFRVVTAAIAFAALPALSQTATPPSLDFEYFKARIEPIFTTKRPGNAAVSRATASARR
jgi:hypothetical protein